MVFTGTQHALDLIDAKGAWNFSIGDKDIVIGMTDWYVNQSHEDLTGKVGSTINSTTFPNLLTEPTKDYHGTVVAGAIGANTDNNYMVLSSIGYNCKAKLY